MSTTIELKYPFKHKGGEFKQLVMRRPRVVDLDVANAVAGGPSAQEKTLFANLCEIEVEVIGELDLLDYGQLQEVYEGFLSPPESGSTSTT